MKRWLVRQALQAVFPAGGAIKGLGLDELDRFLDRFDAEAPATLRLGVIAGSALIMLSPIATIGVPLPAALLSEAQRDEHVHRLMTHRLYLVRQAAFVAKMVGGLAWSQDPDVRADLGQSALGPDPGTFRGSF